MDMDSGIAFESPPNMLVSRIAVALAYVHPILVTGTQSALKRVYQMQFGGGQRREELRKITLEHSYLGHLPAALAHYTPQHVFSAVMHLYHPRFKQRSSKLCDVYERGSDHMPAALRMSLTTAIASLTKSLRRVSTYACCKCATIVRSSGSRYVGP